MAWRKKTASGESEGLLKPCENQRHGGLKINGEVSPVSGEMVINPYVYTGQI